LDCSYYFWKEDNIITLATHLVFSFERATWIKKFYYNHILFGKGQH
jgi:hypothetical protein